MTAIVILGLHCFLLLQTDGQMLLHVMGGISKSFFVIVTPRDPISSAVLVSLRLFFFTFIFFLAAPNSALYGIIFG